MNNTTKNPEALTWLKKNENISPLAGNRFSSTSEALEFVKKLYEYGAISVSIDNIFDEEKRVKKEGGPYADSLIVELPKDSDKRKKLFEIYNKEIEKAGYNQIAKDEGQKSIDLWWD